MSAQTVVVLGAGGRIGHLLCSMTTQDSVVPVGVTRSHDPVGLDTPLAGARSPIVVCTRNHHLDAVLAYVHPTRHADLVFVQNGTIRGWLADNDLQQADRGVLWVAVPRKADPPVPGGPSVFVGHWAEVVAGMLDAHGVSAQAVDPVAFAREEAVKLGWICVMGLLGSALSLKVGELDDRHGDEVVALVNELHPVLQASPGLDIDADALVARVRGYSARIPHFPAALKEWRWRNGAVLATARAAGLPTPLHDAWLERAGGAP